MNPASCAASLGMFMTTLPGALKHAIDRLHCGHRAIGFLPTVVAIAHVGVILQRVTRVDQSGDEFFVGREAHDRPSALAMAARASSSTRVAGVFGFCSPISLRLRMANSLMQALREVSNPYSALESPISDSSQMGLPSALNSCRVMAP